MAAFLLSFFPPSARLLPGPPFFPFGVRAIFLSEKRQNKFLVVFCIRRYVFLQHLFGWLRSSDHTQVPHVSVTLEVKWLTMKMSQVPLRLSIRDCRINESRLFVNNEGWAGGHPIEPPANKGGGVERWCQDMPARYSLIPGTKPNPWSANQKPPFNCVSKCIANQSVWSCPNP